MKLTANELQCSEKLLANNKFIWNQERIKGNGYKRCALALSRYTVITGVYEQTAKIKAMIVNFKSSSRVGTLYIEERKIKVEKMSKSQFGNCHCNNFLTRFSAIFCVFIWSIARHLRASRPRFNKPDEDKNRKQKRNRNWSQSSQKTSAGRRYVAGLLRHEAKFQAPSFMGHKHLAHKQRSNRKKWHAARFHA